MLMATRKDRSWLVKMGDISLQWRLDDSGRIGIPVMAWTTTTTTGLFKEARKEVAEETEKGKNGNEE
ncbi:hypothetical protein SDJN02_12319, partial [Cucurbita argyrosperma subsp. argyrosperma]